jgi:hypothetical protein
MTGPRGSLIHNESSQGKGQVVCPHRRWNSRKRVMPIFGKQFFRGSDQEADDAYGRGVAAFGREDLSQDCCISVLGPS